MTIELLGAVTPIHLIGESHCLKFTDMLFRPTGADDAFQTRVSFLPGLFAADYAKEGFAPELQQVLIGQGLFDRDGKPAFLTLGASAAYLAGRPVIAPPMVFFAGDMDLHGLFRDLAAGYDFELPDDPGYGADRARAPLSHAVVRGQIERLFSPFLKTMAALRASFSRLMVHSLPPRTPDDQRAARWTGGERVPAPLRAKLTVLANRVLNDGCAALDIPFIGDWSALGQDGYLRPDLDLDGVHVDRPGALVSLSAIVSALYDRTAANGNPARYETLIRQAPPYVSAEPPQAAHWAAHWAERGVAIGGLDRADAALLAKDLLFIQERPNFEARPDWVGHPRSGRGGVSTAALSSEQLQHVWGLLGAEPARDLLHIGSQIELTMACVRAVELAAGQSLDPAVLPTPIGCRRALLLLDGEGRLDLTDAAFAGSDSSAVRAGDLIVFDPRRAGCRLTAVDGEVRALEIALAPRLRNHPFRATGAGLCDWPADPFTFSVRALAAHPPFETLMVNERSELW